MRYYFVDYENVKNQGMKDVEKLKKGDKVILMYSRNANTMTIPVMQKVFEATAKGVDFTYIDVKHLGVNALDFQLSMLIGHIIGKFRGTELDIKIVSNDRGFDSLVYSIPEYFKDSGIRFFINRQPHFTDIRIKSDTHKEEEVTKEAEKNQDSNIVVFPKNKREQALETMLVTKLRSNNAKEEEISLWIQYIKEVSIKGKSALQTFKSVYLPNLYPGTTGRKKRNELFKRLEPDIKNLIKCYQSNIKMCV